MVAETAPVMAEVNAVKVIPVEMSGAVVSVIVATLTLTTTFNTAKNPAASANLVLAALTLVSKELVVVKSLNLLLEAETLVAQIG